MRYTHARLRRTVAELTLTGLRVVQAVAALGSFTRAAEELGYTQSAVSRQVAAMEQAAGTPIFDRGRRGAEPTPAGEILVRAARQILSRLSATELELTGLRDRLAGRLAVGAYPVAAMALVPGAMARLQAEHPGLAVVLEEAATPALLQRLRARRLDLAVIGVGQGLPEYNLDELEQTIVLRGELLVAVSVTHRFAGRAQVDVEELESEPWIAGAGTVDEPQFGPWPTLSDPIVARRARSWPVRIGCVAADLGITTVPELSTELLPNGVRTVRVADRAWRGRATLAVTRLNPTPQTQAMRQALQTRAKEIARHAAALSGHGG